MFNGLAPSPPSYPKPRGADEGSPANGGINSLFARKQQYSEYASANVINQGRLYDSETSAALLPSRPKGQNKHRAFGRQFNRLGGNGRRFIDRSNDTKSRSIVPFSSPNHDMKRWYHANETKEEDINSLLLESGVNYGKYGLDIEHKSGKPSYLPLEIFDDTDFETRTPQGWLDVVADSLTKDGIARKSVARALRFDAGVGSFDECLVKNYNKDEERYHVVFLKPSSDGMKEAILSRLHLLFLDENVRMFAQRVAAAHERRRAFEASIRYSLYIDNMPMDEVQPMDGDQINRVLNLTLNTRKMRLQALDTSTLIREIKADYASTMNRMIFDASLKDPSQVSTCACVE